MSNKGCIKGREKRQWSPPAGSLHWYLRKSFRFDCIHRTNVIAGAAIDAFVKINYVLVALLAYCVDRAYSITRSTVIAFVSNVMSTHAFHLLFQGNLATHEKAYTGSFHCQSLALRVVGCNQACTELRGGNIVCKSNYCLTIQICIIHAFLPSLTSFACFWASPSIRR